MICSHCFTSRQMKCSEISKDVGNYGNNAYKRRTVLSILQMPSGIPVATMALDGAKNAAIFAVQILASSDPGLFKKFADFKKDLAQKIAKANDELSKIKYKFKTN